ncbi:MAG: glycosyltransferase [Lachnospiraceae bacterium]|nr:glycosyltransferase [Lachnospiraceae bacterium]
MKFLIVQALWSLLNAADIIDTLSRMGYEVEEYPKLLKSISELSDDDVGELVEYVKEHHVQVILSISFIMNVALAAYKGGIKYVSVLWDAPYTDVYNPLSRLENVWISTFDKLDRERFSANGMPHVLYQPLSVNRENLLKWNKDIQETLQGHYMHDISFIGSLYDGNAYKKSLKYIPMQMQYYFNSIFEEAVFKWDGVNRICGQTSAEIIDYIKRISPKFVIPNRQDIEDVRYFEIIGLIREAANIERIAVLNLLAEDHSVMLYTTEHKAAEEKLKGVKIGPPVEYGKATALVYAGSKINLNISLKGIEGGTPQRIMDIMGAGGFVLTSYCAETAELFKEDQEIVMFRTPEELVEKVDYYLAHESEREEIAQRGYEKVMKCYTYENKLSELIAWIMKEKELNAIYDERERIIG